MESAQTARIYQPRDEPFDLDYYRKLKRGMQDGSLLRLVRGQFIPLPAWEELSDYERFHVQLRTIANRDIEDAVLVGQSAAFAWGLPLPSVSEHVALLRARPGARNGSDFVRRVSKLETFSTVRVSGCEVLGKVEAAVDAAALVSHTWSVAIFDRVLNPEPLPLEMGAFAVSPRREVLKSEIASVIGHAKSLRAQDRLSHALEMADGRAESPGESRARVIIVLGGLEVPELQVVLRDEDGFVARVDMRLRESKMVLEFDGMIKFMDPSITLGRNPGEIAWAEKRREDRIRALGYNVVRIVWSDLAQPERLVEKLRRAGALDARET
ncbi:hypothetical protein [Haematomicrobium sanguinis]|uniref:hypothetical protein n=1 Tax=Haematomicrobium sanguinis TaxID=479106 RepID=UPI00047C1530|nr:hypothetical protein [Haematomicrobium sanguinis]